MDRVDVTEPVFLRPDVKIEPLVCRWYAWPHLISPGQHALNVAFRHLPNLQSFVANPTIHTSAARDPKLFGGPFVSLTEADVPKVRALIKKTTELYAHRLTFAQDLRTFDQKLQNAAKGYSLDEFYADLPSTLQGLLELTYDLNNHAKIKLLEELVYADPLLTDRGGEEICLHRIADCKRPFFMSTPLVDGLDRVFLNIGFADQRVSMLASTRITPKPLSEVAASLDVKIDDGELFRSLFTTHQPLRKNPNYAGDQVRIRYFGHACVLLQSAQVSVLLDPLTAWERTEPEATLTFSDLPDSIDYAVLTHCHQDHCVPEFLIQLRDRVGQVVVPRNDSGNIADPSMKLLLRRLGYSNVTVVDPFDRIVIPDGEILSIPFIGEHSNLDINSKHCIVVRLKERRFLFLVDSDVPEPTFYDRIAKHVGEVDAMFIGMECHGAPLSWMYGPLLSQPAIRRQDESRRLSGSNCERAWAAMQRIAAPRAYVYAMGQEPWLRGLMGLQYESDSVQIVESNRFVEMCRKAGKHAERLYGCREFTF